MFGADVRFAQAHTALVFARSLLDLESPEPDEGMLTAMREVAERQLACVPESSSYASRVSHLMTKQAPARVSMASAASSLGLSERSLRRRLGEEGRTWQELEREALASVAKRLLHDRGRTIQETAYEMGFADATAFHRAFKRWTGSTPGVFLAQLSRERPRSRATRS